VTLRLSVYQAICVVEVAEGCSVAGVRGNRCHSRCKRAYAIVFASWIVSRFRIVCGTVSDTILFGSCQLFVRFAVMNRCSILAVR
jgi:hypothetical protein